MRPRHRLPRRPAARQWPAEYCLALAERAERELPGPAQAAWLEALEREYDNLEAALRWAVGHEPAGTALRLSGALWRFWWVRGR